MEAPRESRRQSTVRRSGSLIQLNRAPSPRYDIITVLGYDAIPAILEPKIVSIEEADEWMAPSEQVIGLSINGDHRAYSIPMLSRHEIVNDTVGGKPVAVTW